MLRNRLWGFTAILILGMTAIIPNVAAQGNTFELRYVIGDKLDGDTFQYGNIIPAKHFPLFLKECERQFNNPDPKDQPKQLKQLVKQYMG